VDERDDEGRPVPTRNAGAFLAPSGLIPVPSSPLDDVERPGRRRRPLSLPSAALTVVAVSALLDVVLRYVLAATQTAAEVEPVVSGDAMTRLLHSDGAWIALHGMILILGVALAAHWGHLRRPAGLAVLTVIGLAGMVISDAVVSLMGGVALGILGLASAAWLVAVYRR
jgi:hypothetical protein